MSINQNIMKHILLQTEGLLWKAEQPLQFSPKVFQYLGKLYNEWPVRLYLSGTPLNETQAQLFENEGIQFESEKAEQIDLVLSTDPADASKHPDVAFVAFEWGEEAWPTAFAQVAYGIRRVTQQRQTKETQIKVELNLEGDGKADIQTGIGFFNHMLEQIARHAQIDLRLHCKGDLHIDEHHSVEDSAIVLGQAFREALGDKKGIERYAFVLPMDDCKAEVALDFGGRSWLVWEADFKREAIGDLPTELFEHFFKSFCDAAACNLNIRAEGKNEHHKIEAIFKGFAKCIRQAIRRDVQRFILPSSKGMLA